MKSYVIISLICCFSYALFGAIVWNEPTEIINYDNIKFEGTGVKTSDNGIVLYWNEGAEPNRHGCLQKFNSQMQPVWLSPIILPTELYQPMLLEASDDNVILFWKETSNNACLRALKINRDGQYIWNQAGVIASSLVNTPCGSNFKSVADNAGGAFLSWTDNTTSGSIEIQHIDANGVRTMGTSGIILNSNYNQLFHPDMLVLPDNSVIVTYRLESQLVIKRFSSTASVLWTQVITQTNPQDPWVSPRLCSAGLDTFYLVAYSTYRITTMKYTQDGNPLWQQPVTVVSYPTAEIEFAGFNYAVNSGNGTIISWVKDETIFAQKLNGDGLLQWDTDGVQVADAYPEIYSIELESDNLSGCYVFYCHRIPFSSSIRMNVQHISDQGTTLSEPVVIRDASCIPSAGFRYYLTELNNNLLINWIDYRDQVSGIYSQCISPLGMEQSAEDIAVHTGTYGIAMLPVFAARSQDAIVVWLSMDLFCNYSSDYSKIYYDVVLQDGSHLSDGGGINLSSSASHRIQDVKICTTAYDYTLITWSETDGGYRIKAQLLDENCNELWDANGKIVFESTQPILKYFCSYENGAYYIVWTAKNSNQCYRIYGQKYINGIAQWALPGIQLVANSPTYPESHANLSSLNGRFITWCLEANLEDYSSGLAYILKFDENGSCMPGFSAYGNQIASLPMGCYGQDITESYSFQDELIVLFSNVSRAWDVDNEIYYTITEMAQKINAIGSHGWGENGIAWIHEAQLVISDSNIYTGAGWNNYFLLSQYDSSGNLCLTHNVAINGIDNYFMKMQALPGQRIVVTARVTQNIQSELRHFYYFENGDEFYLPSDNVLTQDNKMAHQILANNGNQAMILWASGGNYSNSYLSQMQVQLLNNGDVPIDDDIDSPVAQLTLHNNYPNPFTKTTAISFDLKSDAICELSIYNTKGQLVKHLQKGLFAKGKNAVEWDGLDNNGLKAANGVYFFRLTDGKQTKTSKMCLIK